jgi:hypothetical protein
VCLYSPANADLIMDIEGFFDPWTGALRPVFTPLEPVRVLDTRDGTGVVDRHVGPLGARQVIEVQIAGCQRSAGGRPLGGAQRHGHRCPRSWLGHGVPLRQPLPFVSNLNFVRGIDRANAVKAKIGAGGKVCFYTESQTELVADQFGYFALPRRSRTYFPSKGRSGPTSPRTRGGSFAYHRPRGHSVDLRVGSAANAPARGARTVCHRLSARGP